MPSHYLQFSILSTLLLAGCVGRMPLVGFNGEGEGVEALVNEAKYIDYVTEALLTSRDSALPVLEKGVGGGQWKLSAVTIGFSAKAEAGIGPFKLGIRPGIYATISDEELPPPRKATCDR